MRCICVLCVTGQAWDKRTFQDILSQLHSQWNGVEEFNDNQLVPSDMILSHCLTANANLRIAAVLSSMLALALSRFPHHNYFSLEIQLSSCDLQRLRKVACAKPIPGINVCCSSCNQIRWPTVAR